MDVGLIIQQVEQAGIHLSLEGERIAVRPISKLSTGLREFVSFP
jgi:hypothetical protein